MTLSILARDPNGALGAAVAGRLFAVGALAKHSKPPRGRLPNGR